MRRLGLLLLGILLLTGCSRTTPSPQGSQSLKQVTFTEPPPLGPAKTVAPGVLVHEVALKPGSPAGAVWIYLPEKSPSGKLPCASSLPRRAAISLPE